MMSKLQFLNYYIDHTYCCFITGLSLGLLYQNRIHFYKFLNIIQTTPKSYLGYDTRDLKAWYSFNIGR